MKTLLCLIPLFFALKASAQEHVGHGKLWHPRQQQQKQQAPTRQFRVIRDDEAEAEWMRLSMNKTPKDLSFVCSEPVLSIGYYGWTTTCFDRGENFTRASRYKCYLYTGKEATAVGSLIFNAFHNRCGGDGIHPVKAERQQ